MNTKDLKKKQKKKMCLWILAVSGLIVFVVILFWHISSTKKERVVDTEKTEEQSESVVYGENEDDFKELQEWESSGESEEITVMDSVENEDEKKQEIPLEPSGLVVCIDPGHYQGSGALSGEGTYGYEEGVFTLQIALELKKELQKYGIDAYLTRDTGDISINGFCNRELDSGNISLRGEAAKGADLFVSIHTNANQENANGFPTCAQPIEINKTIIIVNRIACESDLAIAAANEIGSSVTQASYEWGISFADEFRKAERDSLMEWTDGYNDSLNTRGTVCYRWGEHGDYYGVLRGATNVGVAGMIVEHGFHTIAELRRLAMTDDLAQAWAKADAYGIAKGFEIIE